MEEPRAVSTSAASASTSVVAGSASAEAHLPARREKSSSSHQHTDHTPFGDSPDTTSGEEDGEGDGGGGQPTGKISAAHGDLEAGEYERKREAYWARILFCERKFYGDLRTSYMKIRMRELERSQNDILNRCAPVFLERRAQLDEEFAKRREQTQIRRQLQLLSLDRVVDGERKSAETNRNNDRQLLRASAVEAEQARAAKAKELERLTGIRFNEDNAATSGDAEGEGDGELRLKVPAELALEASERPEGIERYRMRSSRGGDASPNNAGGSEFYWHDVPVVISQLPKHMIKEDLEMLTALDAH